MSRDSHPSVRAGERGELVGELADAVESRDVAHAVYLAAPEYTDVEDRALAHLVHCQAAVAIAERRLSLFDRGRPAPARWAR